MLSLSSQDRPISSLSPSAGAPSQGASAGTGILEFGRAGMTDSPGSGRTVVTQAYAQSPLRLLNPRNHGTSSWVYTSTYGGGTSCAASSSRSSSTIWPGSRGVLASSLSP